MSEHPLDMELWDLAVHLLKCPLCRKKLQRMGLFVAARKSKTAE